MIYVTSDIHGDIEHFFSIVNTLKEDDVLYILGDVIDRGRNSLEILKIIQENKNIILIKGNHEWMLHQMIELYYVKDIFQKAYKQSLANYIENGGQHTFEHFLSLNEIEKDELYQYLKTLPYYAVVDNYILVHGGYNMKYYKEGTDVYDFLKSQYEFDILWVRDEFILHNSFPGYKTIFGHTVTHEISGEYKIWYSKDKIGIDCGAFLSSGKQALLRLDDLKEFYFE